MGTQGRKHKMTRTSTAAAIAQKVYEAEQINAAMLGYDRIDCAVLSYAAWTETFCRAFEADRPAVHLPCRMISRDLLERVT